jgi:hypothetical protein
MSDGDNLIVGTNNTAQSQTNLNVGLGTDTSGQYGLHVQALDGHAVGGISAVGFGVEGISNSGAGVAGKSTSDDGTFGSSTSGAGAHGTSISGSGVRGTSFQGTAVEGFSFGAGAAVMGSAPYQTGPGVVGASSNSFGVRGQSGSADLLPPVGGGPQFLKCGVQGSSDEGTGVRGDSAHKVGVRGRSFSGDGVFGSCSDQPNGPKTIGNGIHGTAPRSSPNATTGPFAGRFDGDVRVSGNFYVGNTLIAYPTLKQFHLALAAGMVALDGKGEAIVRLPKGTGSFHTNFRYQLTPIGGPAPNLHIAQQIRGDQFKIAGGAGKLSVSWQVAGELKDRRVAIEHAVEKPYDEKMAQAYRRDSKTFARAMDQMRDRERRLTKRGSGKS